MIKNLRTILDSLGEFPTEFKLDALSKDNKYVKCETPHIILLKHLQKAEALDLITIDIDEKNKETTVTLNKGTRAFESKGLIFFTDKEEQDFSPEFD